uniref:Uncharacterized protein n=1 Tax=Anguilla anguilla TaxID=7936 RepID=A0A0E9SRD9_ANGAN
MTNVHIIHIAGLLITRALLHEKDLNSKNALLNSMLSTTLLLIDLFAGRLSGNGVHGIIIN